MEPGREEEAAARRKRCVLGRPMGCVRSNSLNLNTEASLTHEAPDWADGVMDSVVGIAPQK